MHAQARKGIERYRPTKSDEGEATKGVPRGGRSFICYSNDFILLSIFSMIIHNLRGGRDRSITLSLCMMQCVKMLHAAEMHLDCHRECWVVSGLIHILLFA